MKQLPLGVRLRAAATFESFVPGANTELLAALRNSGAEPGLAPAPLWLWGGHGCGKTHLLQAVCAATGDTAAYFPLDRSLALPPQALVGFEGCRVLCVDDVDVAAGEAAWEHGLFRLFNEAAELRTRLVFAAGAAPRGLLWELEDWRSRAAACVVYQLHELDEEGMALALSLRAAQRGLQMPRETSDYLLRRLPRDLPSLFEILDHLDEASLVAQRRLTIPFIRDALEKRARTKP
jgi:DnaA family protein